MPSFQTVAERCNVLFGSEGIGALRGQVDLFVSHETLGAIAVRLVTPANDLRVFRIMAWLRSCASFHRPGLPYCASFRHSPLWL